MRLLTLLVIGLPSDLVPLTTALRSDGRQYSLAKHASTLQPVLDRDNRDENKLLDLQGSAVADRKLALKAGRVPLQDVLRQEFEDMGEISASYAVEKTMVVETGLGTDQSKHHVVYDLTLGSPVCPHLADLPAVAANLQELSGGRSGSLVVRGAKEKYIMKNVAPAEFYMTAPLVTRRESLRDSLKGPSALYHKSLLAPICWGLSELSQSDTVWTVMPNIAVPTSSALDAVCQSKGSSSHKHLFDIKGYTNNGPIRSWMWQNSFGRRDDWEYGFETQYPDGLEFQRREDREAFYAALDSDLKALEDEDLCDYSMLVVVYGCEGVQEDVPNATANAFDFPVKSGDKSGLRLSLALIDFAMKYADIPTIEREVGAKGWSAQDYGKKLKDYVTSVMK